MAQACGLRSGVQSGERPVSRFRRAPCALGLLMPIISGVVHGTASVGRPMLWNGATFVGTPTPWEAATSVGTQSYQLAWNWG